MQKDTQKLVKRRLIFFAVTVLCALLQNTDGYFPSVFGAHFFILIPLCIAIAIFEGEIWGSLFGIFAGALWDFVRGGGDGYNVLFLFLMCVFSGLLVRFLMQKNFVTALSLTAGSCFLYSVFYVMFFISAQGIDNSSYLFFRFYLPSAVLSTLLVVIFYPFAKAVSKKYAVEY